MDGQLVANNWHFREDGTAVLTVPFRWQAGSYRISGEQMEITMGRGSPLRGAWRMEGPVLVLPGLRGPQKFFRL